jgi:hypothetical protein
MLQARNRPRLSLVVADKNMEPVAVHRPSELECIRSFVYREASRRKRIYFTGTGRLNQRRIAEGMGLSASQVWRVLYGESQGPASRNFLDGLVRLANLAGLAELSDQLHDFKPYPTDAFLRDKKAQSKKKRRR